MALSNPLTTDPNELRRQALLNAMQSPTQAAPAPALPPPAVEQPQTYANPARNTTQAAPQTGADKFVNTGVSGIGPGAATGTTDPAPALAAPTAPRGNNPQSTDTFRYGQGSNFRSDVYGQAPGFNLERDQNPDKSAKDAFLFEANQDDAASTFRQAAMDKSDDGALEQWFRQYIMPDMIARGYQIDDVVGDKALISSWDGSGWTDYVGNAGADNASLAWQPQGGDMGAGGGSAATGGGGLSADPNQYANSDVLDQIMRQLQGLQGGENPMYRDAIMNILGAQQ